MKLKKGIPLIDQHDQNGFGVVNLGEALFQRL